MNKVIIVFGLFLLLIAGIAFYQFSKNQGIKTNGKVTIAKQLFTVEVVKESKAQQIGLTKYNALKDNQAMLFVFDKPDTYGFWMKNMKFPIDIIFINNDKVVSFVENAKPVPTDEQNPTIYQPTSPADKTLEINAGLIKKYNIKAGDTVKIELN